MGQALIRYPYPINVKSELVIPTNLLIIISNTCYITGTVKVTFMDYLNHYDSPISWVKLLFLIYEYKDDRHREIK